MGKLTTFTFISLDGYYKGLHEDISWHRHGAEEGAFSADSLSAGNVLLFGRRTYGMMESFWPTPMAAEQFPQVAEGMNRAAKIVFSRTLTGVTWSNTRLVKEDMIGEVRRLRQQSSRNLTLLGSGSVLTQLAGAGLIDEYSVMIDPVALGRGSSLFEALPHKLDLELTGSRVFSSGVVLLTYRPAGTQNGDVQAS